MKRKNKLIIDCSFLCYRTFYALGGLEYQGKDTDIVYGFLSQIYKLSKDFNSDEFIFCWDSEKSYRKLIYSEYKSNRKKEGKEKFYKGRDLLKEEILSLMGFKNSFFQTGYEADDLIAELVYRQPNNYIIVSADSDLWQLLCDGRYHSVKMYNFKTMFDAEAFHKCYGVNPIRWYDVKAITGCDSDDVEGLEGIGVKTAIKYLLRKASDRATEKINQNTEIIDRNRNLVALPFVGKKPIKLNKVKEESLYKLNFYDVFQKYGFGSFIKNFSQWEERFNLLDGRE